MLIIIASKNAIRVHKKPRRIRVKNVLYKPVLFAMHHKALIFPILVLSAGIEPTLPAPQAGVLSVERRERYGFILILPS